MIDSVAAVKSARRLYDAALACIADQDGVHPQTACTLMAVVLGMTLYRKHHPEPTQAAYVGQPFFSQVVEDDRINILTALDRLAKDGGLSLNVLAPAGAPVSLTPEQGPLVSPVELLQRHGGGLWTVVAQGSSTPEERLLAALFAVLFIARQTAPALPADLASSLILLGFAAGSGSVPPN